MQEVSALYNQITSQTNHWFETILVIGELDGQSISDAGYGEHYLFSIKTSHRVFNEDYPTVGSAISGEIDIEMIDPGITIPKRGKLRPYVRATDGTLVSEWIAKGVYYVDTREVTRNSDGLDVLRIHGYDDILKLEVDYPSDSQHDYPMTDIDMVEFIAESIGVELDERTEDALDKGYQFPLMVGYSSREALGIIAASYGGNFIMSDEGKLLLITLGSLPKDTNYLTDELGNRIQIGEDRIVI